MKRVLLAVCAFNVWGAMAIAEMPAGADAPAFIAAKEGWLAGDQDAAAALYELAGQGNVAALILYRRLLGQASDRGEEIGPGLEDGWLDYANDSELARAFDILWNSNGLTPEENVAELFRVGEPIFASWLAHAELGYSSDGDPFGPPIEIWAKLVGADLPPPIRFINHFTLAQQIDPEVTTREWTKFCQDATAGKIDFPPVLAMCEAALTEDNERLEALFSVLMGGDQSNDPDGKGTRFLRNWIASDPKLPHARLCRKICPDHSVACGEFLFRDNAYMFGLASHVTPVETLISQEEYLNSPMALRTYWRQVLSYYEIFERKDSVEFQSSVAGRCISTAIEAGFDPVN